MAEVAIAGAGVVGLASALLLARREHEVVVLERDDPPPGGSPDDDAYGWHRPGVPQADHAHGFLGRTSRVLREEAPDVAEAMVARGAATDTAAFGDGQHEEVLLQSRRLVFEATLRRIVERERGVTLRTGVNLRGLVAELNGRRPTIRGLRTSDGETILADLTIDCCGRRSQTPRWLSAIGADAPVEEHVPCDMLYVTRHYRLRAGQEVPSGPLPLLIWLPYGVFLVFGGDNGTFALGGAVSQRDPLRRTLLDDAVFHRVMGAIPPIAAWLDVGDPITEINVMAGIANRRRSLMVDGAPVARGYAMVGDASIYTNASMGLGISIGLWQTQHLARISDRIGSDDDALTAELETWTDRNLGPRFAAQSASDERRTRAWVDGIAGAPLPEPPEDRRPIAALITLAGQGSELAAAAVGRIVHLFSEPEHELAEPRLAAEVAALLATSPTFGGGHGPLSRERFEALVGSGPGTAATNAAPGTR